MYRNRGEKKYTNTPRAKLANDFVNVYLFIWGNEYAEIGSNFSGRKVGTRIFSENSRSVICAKIFSPRLRVVYVSRGRLTFFEATTKQGKEGRKKKR